MYGSVINRVMERGGAKPEVGMGASMLLWSDRHAASIVAVGPDARWVDVKRDNAIVVSGGEHNGSAEYRYEPNPGAPVERFSRRKNGAYIKEGEPMRSGMGLAIGRREEYRDPHF